MKSTLFLSIIAIILLTFQSCTVAKISGKGAVPVLLNQPAEQMALSEHVKVKKNINFDWSCSFDVSEVIAKSVAEKQPDAVINTTITIKKGIDNWFINVFTLGLAQSKKVVIDADFMKEK